MNLWETTPIPWSSAHSLDTNPRIVYRGAVPRSGVAFQGIMPHYVWWRINRGVCHLRTEQESFTLREGEWVMIPAGIWRIQRFEPDNEIISIHFSCHWPSGIPALKTQGLLRGVTGTVPGLEACASRICDVLDAHVRPNRRNLMDYSPTLPDLLLFRSELPRFIAMLLGYAAREGGVLQRFQCEDPRLEHVLLDLRGSPRAGPLPYERWQRLTGLGRSHLERLARRHLGTGLHALRDRLLLLSAYRQLTGEPSLLVKQVAEELGFVDSSHFCRWFRQKTGQSPAAFRHQPV